MGNVAWLVQNHWVGSAKVLAPAGPGWAPDEAGTEFHVQAVLGGVGTDGDPAKAMGPPCTIGAGDVCSPRLPCAEVGGAASAQFTLRPCRMPCSGSGDARRRCGAEGRAGSGHEGSPVRLEDKEEVSCGDETELQRAVQVGTMILTIARIRFIHHWGEEECTYLSSSAMNQTG